MLFVTGWELYNPGFLLPVKRRFPVRVRKCIVASETSFWKSQGLSTQSRSFFLGTGGGGGKVLFICANDSSEKETVDMGPVIGI